MQKHRADRIQVGPSPIFMVLGSVVGSWLARAGLTIALVVGSPAWHGTREVVPHRFWLMLARCNELHVGLVGIAMLLAACIFAIVQTATSRYELTEFGLIVTHGFFTRQSRRGFLKKDQRTVSLLVIRDAECSQGIVSALCKVGLVRVRSYDGEIVSMPFTERASDVAAAITSAAVRRQRMQ